MYDNREERPFALGAVISGSPTLPVLVLASALRPSLVYQSMPSLVGMEASQSNIKSPSILSLFPQSGKDIPLSSPLRLDFANVAVKPSTPKSYDSYSPGALTKQQLARKKGENRPADYRTVKTCMCGP